MVDNVTLTEVDSLAARIIEGTILSLICPVAFFGNISLWLVVLKTRDLRNESNYLLLCLSSADILVSLGMPITCLTIFHGTWIFSDELCQALGFLNMVTFISSVTSLGVISLNRYIKVCKPHHYHAIYTKRNIFIMVSVVWGFSSSLATPPLIGWGAYSYLPSQSFCFCDWTTSISYTFVMVGICFGGPCIVMTVCYVCILRTLRASSRKVFNSVPRDSHSVNKDSGDIPVDDNSKTEIVKEDTSDIAANTSSNTTNHIDNKSARISTISKNSCASVPKPKLTVFKRSNRKEKRRQEEIRITMLFLTVVFAFVISWLPFCVDMFLVVFVKDYSVPPFAMFTLLLGYANSCYNPFIYGFMNQRVKKGYKTVFSKLRVC